MSVPGPGASHESIRGIGVDLARIPRMREVVERWQDRFLRRVFTEAEIAYCQRRHDPIPHLAARFAAKEAAMKALGTGLRMGVTLAGGRGAARARAGAHHVLTGRSAAIARAKGASRILVSLTHDGDYAFAQAMLVDETSATSDRGAAPATASRVTAPSSPPPRCARSTPAPSPSWAFPGPHLMENGGHAAPRG